MITDKHELESKIIIDMVGGNSEQWREIRDVIARLRPVSAEQARKEAAKFYERQYEEMRTWNAERFTPEGWFEMVLRHKNERAAILGDSTAVSTDAEKLAIAVNALEVIRDNALNPAHTMTKFGLEQVTDANRAISDRALKEIQG